MRLNSALLDQAKAKTFGSGSLWASLKKDFRMGEVNSELVRRHESKFAANGAYFDRTITRGKPYMYHNCKPKLKNAICPLKSRSFPSLKAHSSPKPNPTSAHPACGSSCRQPAVISAWKNTLYDGRHAYMPRPTPRWNYLQYLHGLFNDWSLALAAYNWGEGNVGRAVNRARAQGLEPTYETCACRTKHATTFQNCWLSAISSPAPRLSA